MQLRQTAPGVLSLELTPSWREDVRDTFEEAAWKVEKYGSEEGKKTHFAHCGTSWMRAQGPAYREADVEAVTEEVADIARDVSPYGRAVNPGDLRRAWKNGWHQWTSLLASDDLPDLSYRPQQNTTFTLSRKDAE